MEILKSGSIFSQIVKTANRLEVLANKYILEPLELTISSLTILDLIYKDKSVTPTQMMKAIYCSKSNITQRLNVMEKGGLIVRKPSPSEKDKRKIGIAMTEEGKKRYLQAMTVVRSKGAEVESRLRKADIADHHLFLENINRILDSYEQKKS